MEHIVEIRDMAYLPAKITINQGDQIVWRNMDDMGHTATRKDAPPFDTGKITQGSSSSAVVFNEASYEEGFIYYCKPHPFMKGIVVVLPNSKLKI